MERHEILEAMSGARSNIIWDGCCLWRLALGVSRRNWCAAECSFLATHPT